MCTGNAFALTLVFTFQEHQGRVFRLQFDEFEIISSAHDDTILIWDFLNATTDMAAPNTCTMESLLPTGTEG